MPKPNKNESKQEFLKRCTLEVVGEGRDRDQAFAMCNSYWDDSNNQRSVLTLSAPVVFKKTAGGENDGKRQFAVTGYTGAAIDTWWGQVVFSVPGMKTKEKIPVLREHFRDRVVGFGKAWNDGNNFYVSGDFSAVTADAKEVLELAEEGYPWQASVGIWPRKVKVLDSEKAKATVNGREITGPAEIWEESDVGEVSFVSLGRDDNTAAVSFSESEGKVPVTIEHVTPETAPEATTAAPSNKESVMDLKELQEKNTELYSAVFEKGRAEGVKEERGRVMEIMAADGDALEAKKLIENGTPATECYRRFFEAEKEKRRLGLENLKAQAPKAQGTEPPEEKTADTRSADVILSERARTIMRERQIGYEAACRQALADDPNLKAKYRALYSV
jgi:hypothetical protein